MTGELTRSRVRVTGVVQGVGYRPFAYAAAVRHGISGFVGNDAAGVFLEAQGSAEAVAALLADLRIGPPMARVGSVESYAVDVVVDDVGFAIVESADSSGTTTIPPDTATCADCLADIADAGNRRYRYPFTACTHCGPRYTIVTGLPYDRPFTTMSAFPLCADCQREYDDPLDRRFHAQPTACPACGPSLTFRSLLPDEERGPVEGRGDAALAAALAVLEGGGIVAIKGVGGYHLACDARNPDAVARLRARKQRGDKPLALMVRDPRVAASIIETTGIETTGIEATEVEALLKSPEAPIVLAPARDLGLRDSVAPGQGRLGVMAPYSPLHHLLFAPHPDRPGGWVPDALVMTSGNIADEPICIESDEAETRLSHIADAFLHHDRGIHVSCDDSVVTIDQPVRRSRGYAPLPVRLRATSAPALAVGGELKTTICLAQGHEAWLSQHIGDTANLETLVLLERTTRTLGRLVRVRPEFVAADLHPAYLSRRWAEQHASETGAELMLVQHHHAHLASLIAEHAMDPHRPVLGFAFDGTGFGLDGTIWGGEILWGTAAGVERIGHLAPISLPGGDAAVRRPARTALAHLSAAGIDYPVPGTDLAERRIIAQMLASGAGCTPCTSMGRLFDAVSAMIGLRADSDYEGQAAIELECLAESAGSTARLGGLPGFGLEEVEGQLVLDPAPVLAWAVGAVRAGHPSGEAAYGFHAALARAISEAAVWATERRGPSPVGLTGGVFANRLLSRLARERLGERGQVVLEHRLVPPNDGGLALGQIAVTAARTGG